MIIVTGAAGFIGSALIAKLNENRYFDIVAVDDFASHSRHNLEGKQISKFVERDRFLDWATENEKRLQFIFHMGARTDTTEFDEDLFQRLNVDYSKSIWNFCVEYGLPLVYASSAATYGAGEKGYADDHALIPELVPMNPYGVSKNEFDKWALTQEKQPYYWTGLKFFNVYGPNEYHKERMASVVFHAYNQVREQGKIRLFRSHRADFKDGMQLRDFIYVKDVVDVCYWLMHHRKPENSGICNLGTGKAESFLALAHAVFAAMDKKPEIEFIDIPEDIRERYQYFTEAKMEKLRSIGYKKPFIPVAEGVREYIRNYLINGKRW
ncbi:MAG: ADP-glyceromanno-heptose 6-epimerase [Bacteroidia bacterium]